MRADSHGRALLYLFPVMPTLRVFTRKTRRPRTEAPAHQLTMREINQSGDA